MDRHGASGRDFVYTVCSLRVWAPTAMTAKRLRTCLLKSLPFFSMKFAPSGSLLDAGPALRDEPWRSVALMAKVAFHMCSCVGEVR